MTRYTLAHVADDTLLSDLAALVATDRHTTATLLAHIAEVDARELYLPAACSSMHTYCTRVLHLAEDAAFKRIRAARAARRFPPIFEAIAGGRVHLSGVVMLAPHFTDENVDELLAAATHRSKVEIEILIARLAPKPDLPDAIMPVAPRCASETFQLAPGPAPADPAPPATRTTPIAPERYALQMTISQETRDKLERVQALLRHRNPSGDLSVVIDLALDALIPILERKKFGATSRPRAKQARSESADPRYIPNDVKRDVHERDGEQCSFVSADGVRCTERGFLELDHKTPVALGGNPSVDEVRVLCRSHNQYEADRLLGRDFMQAKRDAATVRADHDALATPRSFESDVVAALRGLGYSPAEARNAAGATAHEPAPTLEARLRAALAFLSRSRPIRCSDGSFDVVGWTSRDGAAIGPAPLEPHIEARIEHALAISASLARSNGAIIVRRNRASERRGRA